MFKLLPGVLDQQCFVISTAREYQPPFLATLDFFVAYLRILCSTASKFPFSSKSFRRWDPKESQFHICACCMYRHVCIIHVPVDDKKRPSVVL